MSKLPTSLTIIPVLPRGTAVRFGMVGAASFEPVTTGSSGGWQIVDRPLQKAITQYLDSSPMSLKLSLILDGGRDEVSIEAPAAQVNSWLYPKAGQQQPPVLSVSGPLDKEAKALYWVLYTVKFDEDRVIRNPRSGVRTQQFIDLTLYEYVPATASVLTALSPAKTAQQNATAAGSKSSSRTYVVKSGDTLSSIAARVLGNQSSWQQIAALNHIRDPKSLSVGQVLKLPA